MKVQHKNSLEVLDLSRPKYTKVNSMYGYLVAGAVGKVFFITCGCDDVVCEDVSEDYLESN